MILVDSSVWIDFFRGRDTPQVKVLDALLGRQPLLMGDLILAEVLQGFDKQKDFDEARRLLSSLDLIQIGGAESSHPFPNPARPGHYRTEDH